MNSSKKSPPNSSCFSSIFGRFNCTGNLPTHPCPPEEIPEKNPNPTKNNVSNNNGSGAIVVRSRVQAMGNPGIVARLMGLDSLPNYDNTSKSPLSINDSLFRSKSLNSLHFLPDFNPTRASFHRRVRTSLSASFPEQGHSFLGRIDENLETNGEKMKDIDVGQSELRQKREKIEKVVILKGNESRISKKNSESKKRYQQERYYKGNCTACSSKSSNRLQSTSVRENVVSNKTNNNNSREKCAIQRRKLINKDKNMKIVSIVSRKNKVDHKQDNTAEVQSDVLSWSPVSVLDHQLEFDSPSRENANATQTTSNSKKRLCPKINLIDDVPRQDIDPKSNKKDGDSSYNIASKHKVMKADAEVAEYFANMSVQICTLAEEQLCTDLTRHVRKYDLFKSLFIEELCYDFSQEVLEFLLNELTHELT